MPQFVFQLEGVLRQRRNLEQQRLRELAAIQDRYRQLEADLRAMDQEMREATAFLRQHHLNGKLDMAYLTGHRRYTLAMQRKAMAQVQRMAIVQRQAEEAHAALTLAAQRRKAVEKLRDHQYLRWRQAIERRDMAQMDEIGVQLAYQNLVQSEE